MFFQLIKLAKPKTKSKKTSMRKVSALGPKDAVINLIESGFFATPQTSQNIREYLQHKRGLIFTLEQLSVVMLRVLRDHKLDRDKNAEGQYEYKNPQA